MKKTDYSSSVMKLDDVTNARWHEEGRLACLGDTCAKSLGKVDDDCIFDHPLAGYEGEYNCFEPDFKVKHAKKCSVKESMGNPALLDVLEWENDEYAMDMMPNFLSTSIESSGPRSPMLEAWDGICNMFDEKFSPGHIRKGTLEMNSTCFLRRVVDCKKHHLKIITPGLTTISLPIPRSLGRSESEIKDDAVLTILPGLAAVTLPLPRRLKNVVKTNKDKLPIAPGLSPFQLLTPNDLNDVARIKDDMTHDVALAEVWDAEYSSSLKEKDQYQYENEQQSKAGKSNEGGRGQTEYKIEDRERKIECSNTQGGDMENEKMQQNACRPFHDGSTISGNIISVTTESRIDR